MELRRENEVVLRNLGCQPGVERAPRRVNFDLVFPDVVARSSAQDWISALGFDWEIRSDAVEPGTVEAVAYRTIAPAADTITDAEVALIDSIKSLGGYVDGWGFFGDTEH